MKTFSKQLGILTLSALTLVGCGQASTPVVNPQNHVAPSDRATGDIPKEGKMKPSEPTPMSEEQTKEIEAGKAEHAPTTLTFHVDGGSFFYTPNIIQVKKGDKVKIVFKNVGGMHNFLLDEFNVKMDPIKTNETREVEFTADKAGTFEYYCGVGSHRQMGQKGQLIVTE
jgi:plastocyanin